MTRHKVLRCAIYTRKSSEEGLEQGFNSLHAQREACEAYVRSQAGEGWKLLSQAYDDGGYSGGTMERPGLRLLLDDVEAGRIDVVVVYKVDRLTRALSDFARIVETFDARGVSFVSVTQSFNTTTSMGRLTLNVLLSFAQFEREVTGERIRDKIAASKGMWMGGTVPLGYDLPTDLRSRALVVNPAEAETVRTIFALYIECGSVRSLTAALREKGISTKRWTARNGSVRGGGPWLEGPLYYVLRNRLYRGEIVHKGQVHAGQHEPLVSDHVFKAAQAQLAATASGRRGSEGGAKLLAALKGKVFDDAGHPMSPVSARKGPRTYRYYVSQAVIRSDRGPPGSLARVPALRLERLVAAVLGQLAARNGGAACLHKVVVAADRVILTYRDATTGDETEGPDRTEYVIAGLKRSKPILIGDTTLDSAEPDPALQRAIARSRRWEAQLSSGERTSTDHIAAVEGLQSRYVDKVLRLAWLAPDLVEAVLAGERLGDWGVTRLIGSDLPMDWAEQRRLFGRGPAHVGEA